MVTDIRKIKDGFEVTLKLFKTWTHVATCKDDSYWREKRICKNFQEVRSLIGKYGFLPDKVISLEILETLKEFL